MIRIVYRKTKDAEPLVADLRGDPVSIQRKVMERLGLKWEGPDLEFDRIIAARKK